MEGNSALDDTKGLAQYILDKGICVIELLVEKS